MALGSAKGEFVVPDDFNDPLPKEIEDLFWQSTPQGLKPAFFLSAVRGA